MDTPEITKEQLMTKIETLQMEIEKLKETAAKTAGEAAFQNEEKDKRAAELVIADKELAFQTGEKADRAAELVTADKELAFQSGEKADRAAELVIADKELAFQTGEKADRAAELVIADKELAFQSGEKADRAAELIIANKELAFQNAEKDKRAAELIIANKELAFQNAEKEKRAAELQEGSLQLKERTQQLQTMLTEKECIEQALKESENYYRTIFENTGAATMVIEEDLIITMVNEECQRLLGYAKKDLIGKKWTEFIPGDLVETIEEYHRLRLANLAAVPLKYQTRIIDRQGNYQDGLLAVDIIPGTNKSLVNFIDFTEFNRIGRALKATSAVNQAMLKAENEEDLLRIVCQRVVEVGGYSLAWVAYLEADQQTVQPVAYAGKDEGYLAKLNITLRDPGRGFGPTGTAIRTGQPAVCTDFEKDDTFKPWLKDALRRGFKSSMVLPLMADDKAFGALSIYSGEIGRFDSNEEKLLTEMAGDLAYGIMSLRAHIEKNQTGEELKMSLEKMRRILMQAVASLGNTLEIRDPYTAGHQRRVAHLAAAIAEEIDLSKDQIKGIEVTGNLHDIGKINVPSDILNKPGKLTELEFALIKSHPQAGYEILKDIEFPWPVAEVLLQHHERMNGSGYPRGLAVEDIMTEARIMAVADVVEAISSHRPYRPALGIDATLEEISHNRGILYDPDVVDACLKLFREKGLKLE